MSECVAEGRGEVESEVPVWPGPSCLATEYAAQTFNALDAPKKRPSSSKSLNTMRTKIIKAIKSRQKNILRAWGGVAVLVSLSGICTASSIGAPCTLLVMRP